jgi:hypothetical protein
VSHTALIERMYALASSIRRLPAQSWTDPEKFFRVRSELAPEADQIAREVCQAVEVAPNGKHALMARVAMERGRQRGEVIYEEGTREVSGRLVTVRRTRRAFAIAVRGKS